MIGKLYNYLTTLGSLKKDILCSEGGCTNDDSKSSHNTSHVELESVPKDISEPVISFIKCFEENPRRFKGRAAITSSTSKVFILEDKDACVSYIHQIYGTSYAFCDTPLRSVIYLKNILSKKEIRFLDNYFENYYYRRSQRYKEILAKRKERDKILTRKRLTEIYKEAL